MLQARADDGQVLDVLALEPELTPVACAVVGHAMMVDRRTLWRPDRPSLAGTLLSRGCRVLLPALRGHPPSGPLAGAGGDWSYDRLVQDTPVFVELAREEAPGLPLFLIGHSLFGHTSLAFLGRYPGHPASGSVTGLVAIASTVWGPRWEPDWRRRVAQRALSEVGGVVARLVGYLPVRRFRIGSADESVSYWDDFVRVVRSGHWRARDGFDYWEALGRVRCPVLWVVSEGDRLTTPAQSARFGAPLQRRRDLRVGRLASRADVVISRPPSHTGLVTSPSARPVWEAVADWVVERAARGSSSRPPGTSGEERS